MFDLKEIQSPPESCSFWAPTTAGTRIIGEKKQPDIHYRERKKKSQMYICITKYIHCLYPHIHKNLKKQKQTKQPKNIVPVRTGLWSVCRWFPVRNVFVNSLNRVRFLGSSQRLADPHNSVWASDRGTEREKHQCCKWRRCMSGPAWLLSTCALLPRRVARPLLRSRL